MIKSDGLRMVLRPVRETFRFSGILAGTPVRLAVLLGMAIVWDRWFPSSPGTWWQLFLGMSGLSILLEMGQLTGKGEWISGGILVLLVGICGIFQNQFLSGIACFGNDLMARLTQVTGKIYMDFSIAQEKYAVWGMIPVLSVGVLLLHWCVQTGKIAFFLPIFLIHYAAVLTGMFIMDAGMAFLGAGTVLLWIYTAGAKTDCRGFRGVPTWLVPVLLCMAVAVGVGMRVPIEKSNWKQLIHTVLYDQDTNSMPEGNLENLGAWEKSETPALKITMTQPEKLYLRGKIYETYGVEGWTALDTSAQATYENLFYWLHQAQFYGQGQIGLATSLTTQAEPETITIENLSACEEQGYYPYALAGVRSLDAELIGDSRFPKEQMLTYYPGSVPQWYEVQRTLAAVQERNNVVDYLALEDAYQEYVRTVDLQLTNESWSVLDRHLENGSTPKTLSEIRAIIRDYLKENLVYDEAVQTRNGQQDFVQYTLERSGSGYSVHYATIATLMLRYFGVPARYVEGYYLSAEEAATYQAGQTIVLTEAHAHAWAEYYLPGVGFVPFEVTPGYLDGEELELTEQISQEQPSYRGNQLEYAKVVQPERLEEPQQPIVRFSMKPIWLAYLVLIGLIGLGIWLARRRKRFRRAVSEMNTAPNRDAIALRYGYAVRLLQTCENLSVEGSDRATDLNREALFSLHEMTDCQCREMETYVDRVLQSCKENWTFRKKLYYRFWDCIY